MRISRDALRGYILEEVLAYLVRGAGYRLLVDPAQDPEWLRWRGNGLLVRGHGGEHQVDVLGELAWIPAFTFPLRLFVEAKFRGRPTGIPEVRHAVGVILDVNQRYLPSRHQRPTQRFHYAYALFSTSGFSRHATDMALAHRVSLNDLSGTQYRALRDSITDGANAIRARARNLEETRGRLVSRIRSTIRSELGTALTDDRMQARLLRDDLGRVVATARRYGELFVAMANGPYMLLLSADDPSLFLDYAERHPSHPVRISWSSGEDEGRTWHMQPREEQGAYRLSFRLPRAFERWIFGKKEGAQGRALTVKANFLSSITVYRHVDGRDSLFRLQYEPEETQAELQRASAR